MEKGVARLKVLNFLIAAFTLLLQFNEPLDLKRYTFFPLFPFAFVVVVSMYSSELKAFFIGLILGIFVDSSSSALFSFNTIAYPLLAVIIALLVHYVFNNNLRSCIVLSFFSTVFLLLVRFIVTYFNSGLNDMLKYFLNSIVPSAILTALFAVLLFWAEKRIYKLRGE